MSLFFRLKSIRSDRFYELDKSVYTVGRTAECDIHIDSHLLSRQHAALNIDGGKVTIVDLGSTNGTFVNSMRVQSVVELKHGDVVTLGDEKLVLIAPDPPETDFSDPQKLTEELAAYYRQQDRTSGKTMLRSSYMQAGNWMNSGEQAEPGSPVNEESSVRAEYDKRRTPAVLHVQSGRRKGDTLELRLPFGAEQQWSLGRSALSDVVLDDPTISSEHAIIACARKRWTITDNSSTNGIKLNNIPVKSAVCKTGDVIGIGNVKLQFEIVE